jgi:phage portal protein BeeE
MPAATTATPPAPAPVTVPYASATTIVGLSAVWRCVTLLADVVSRMPWIEWSGDVQRAPSRLVRRPSASMSRREWTWRVVATEALCNTAYLLHVGGTDSEGLPWSLLPVPPAAIAPIGGDPWGMLPANKYAVAGQVVDITQLSIARRAPWPGVPDNVAGIIDLARREFSAYLAADATMARYWVNGGPTQTVISTQAEIDDPQADAIRARWDARRAQGGTAVLGKGADAKPFGADPTTESAVEARREIVADIGRYFGVPTRILNAPAGDSETYSNVEMDALDLMRYTLGGYIDPIQDVISEQLPGDPLVGRRMEIDPTSFVSGSLADRASAYPALVTAGILTIPEARRRGFGLPASPADTSSATAPADALPAGVVSVTTEPVTA